MNPCIETCMQNPDEKIDFSHIIDDLPSKSELPKELEAKEKLVVELPDISFIERTSRAALMELCSIKNSQMDNVDDSTSSETYENKKSGLTEEEKAKIKEETGWSDEIIDNIQNMKQYEVLKKAGLIEVEINGRKCLIKENIDLDYTDEDGISNRDRISRG